MTEKLTRRHSEGDLTGHIHDKHLLFEEKGKKSEGRTENRQACTSALSHPEQAKRIEALHTEFFRQKKKSDMLISQLEKTYQEMQKLQLKAEKMQVDDQKERDFSRKDLMKIRKTDPNRIRRLYEQMITEVFSIPYDQLNVPLEAAGKELEILRACKQENGHDSLFQLQEDRLLLLTSKINLLETRQKEYPAIQQKIEEESQLRAQKILREMFLQGNNSHQMLFQLSQENMPQKINILKEEKRQLQEQLDTMQKQNGCDRKEDQIRFNNLQQEKQWELHKTSCQLAVYEDVWQLFETGKGIACEVLIQKQEELMKILKNQEDRGVQSEEDIHVCCLRTCNRLIQKLIEKISRGHDYALPIIEDYKFLKQKLMPLVPSLRNEEETKNYLVRAVNAVSFIKTI